MSFVPVKLRFSYRTISQTDPRDALELAPALASVHFSKLIELANARSYSNDLDGDDRSDDLEIHDAIVEKIQPGDNLPAPARGANSSDRDLCDRLAGQTTGD